MIRIIYPVCIRRQPKNFTLIFQKKKKKIRNEKKEAATTYSFHLFFANWVKHIGSTSQRRNFVHDKKAHEKIGNNGKVIFSAAVAACCCWHTATENKFAGLLNICISRCLCLPFQWIDGWMDGIWLWLCVCIGVPLCIFFQWSFSYHITCVPHTMFPVSIFFFRSGNTPIYLIYYYVRWTYFLMISNIVQSFLPCFILVNYYQNRIFFPTEKKYDPIDVFTELSFHLFTSFRSIEQRTYRKKTE